MRITLLSALATVLLTFTACPAQNPETAPPGGQVVLTDLAAKASPTRAANGRLEIADVSNAPGFSRVLRFTIDKTGHPWDVQAGIPIPCDIAKGETFLISYWARTISTRHESQQGMLTVKVEETDNPHRGVAGGGVTFPSTWMHFWARGSASADLPKGTVNFKIFAGEAQQVVEIGGIEVLSYGVGYNLEKLPFTRMTYVGREADAPWRKAAEQRIEQIRMAPLAVKVISRDGKPVANAQVSIEQTRSAFQFGIEFAASKVMDRSKPENEVYRQKLPELFNGIVFGNDLKWPARLGDWGPEFNQNQTIAALKWAREHDLFIRGHVMIWPGTLKDWGNLPAFIRAMKDKNPDPAALQQLVLSHIDEVAEATSGYIDEWDVMNEPRDNHALIDLCGTPAMAQWFKRAHERVPQARLAINEYSILSATSDSPTHDTYEYYIRELLKNGAPLDVIGMQGYFGMLVPTPERMLKTLDRFSAMGPHIRVTEYHIKGDDEDLKCDFTRDILTVLYSHPKVDGFHTWLGVQSYVNPDGSLTRLGKTYSDLVLKKWRTNASLTTSETGQCQIRGHLGRYRISVTTPSGTTEQWLTLRQDSPELIVTVR